MTAQLSPGRIFRFLCAGGGSLGLDLTLQALLHEVLALPVWLAAGLSYELALLAHFIVSDRWVFGDRVASRPGVVRRLAAFQVAALTATAITYGVTTVLVYGPTAPLFSAGLGPYLAKVAGTVTATAWTFTASFFWIWRPRPPAPLRPGMLRPEA